jgi:hypothetical protein
MCDQLVSNQPMSEQAQPFDAWITMPRGFAQDLAALLVAITRI